VRFDPLPPARIAEGLAGGGDGGEDPERARACAGLALGDASLAARLAGEEGLLLRGRAEELVRSALAGETQGRPWMGLLEAARAAATAAGEEGQERIAEELELLPSKERKRHEREGGEARRRGERRVRTETIDLGLKLGELWLRDMVCMSEGASELIHAVDRRSELEHDLRAVDGRSGHLREGIEVVEETRLSLQANVSEELALEAMAYRLQALLSG
jgi:DNA polymerase III subunit delta'